MIYPEIKIKEKRKSINFKVKISKKEIANLDLTEAVEIVELKRTILDEISYELDDLIYEAVKNTHDLDYDSDYEQLSEIKDALSAVSVDIDMSETNDYTDETFEESEDNSEEEVEDVTEVTEVKA